MAGGGEAENCKQTGGEAASKAFPLMVAIISRNNTARVEEIILENPCDEMCDSGNDV